MVQSLAWLWCPISRAALWPGVSGARAFAWLGMGHMAKGSQETLQLLRLTSPCPASGASQHTCAPQAQSLSFPQPFYFSQWPSNQPRGLSSPCRTPGLRYLICGSNCLFSQVCAHLCNLPFPESPPRGIGSNMIPLLPFLPDYVCIFLTASVVQESFYQFLLNFQ